MSSVVKIKKAIDTLGLIMKVTTYETGEKSDHICFPNLINFVENFEAWVYRFNQKFNITT